ncbi:MAG: type IV pilus modification protein PilV [Gammaproteobacteria bacterium]|nr:MAG: type IV pilus modification protein PilV [Gammaproteobacteria bacterium]
MSVMQTQKGFTLIEVMIAFFILAVGLLGMAALLTTSVRSNQSAYYRTQAAYLASDMADRIRANRQTPDYASVTGSSQNCIVKNSSATIQTLGCDSSTMAQWDMYDWHQTVAQSLPGGTALVNKMSIVCLDATPQDGTEGTDNSTAACDGTAVSAGGLIAVKVWWDENRDGDITADDPRVVVTLR